MGNPLTTSTKNEPLLFNSSYLLLMFGRLVSNLGDSIYYIGVMWFIYDLVGSDASGKAVGVYLLATTLPLIILSSFAGVFADRFKRKSIIVTTDLIRGFIFLVFWILSVADVLNLFLIYFGTIAITMCDAFFGPAVGSLLPDIVDSTQLSKANSLNSFITTAALLGGGVLGGILYTHVAIHGILIINTVSFFLSGISECFIIANEPKRIFNKQKRKNNSIFLMIKEGFSYIYTKRTVFYIIILSSTINFFLYPIVSMGLPYVLKFGHNLKADIYGYLDSIVLIGTLFGSLLLSVLPDFKKKHNVLIWATNIVGISIILLLLPSVLNLEGLILILTYGVVLLIYGISFMFINVPFNTMMMQIVENEYRGRVFGFITTISQGLNPLSALVFGTILDIIPTTYIFVFCGVTIFILSTSMYRIKGIKSI